MKYIIHENRVFDITGSIIKIKNIYPGIDGRAVCPIGIETGENSITYDLGTANGKIKLTFKLNDDILTINSFLSGIGKIGHFSPIFGSDIDGADRYFSQGYKFGGPTKLSKITDIEDFIDSHGVAALGGSSDNFFLFYVRDFTRFINRMRLLRRNRTIHTNASYAKFSADFQTEFENKSDEIMPEITIKEINDLDSGLKSAAFEIAKQMKARPPKNPKYLWNSWYYLYSNVTEEKITQYSHVFPKMKDRFPMKYMEIDSGYYTSQGDWLNHNYCFPGGMKNAAKIIKDSGYTPGIWVGIFMVGDESILYREHPDWLLHDISGNLVVLRKTYNAGIWGQPNHVHYVLDTSHPGAMAYVKTVFSTLYSWGYRFFKTDFISWGVHDSDKVARYTLGKTSIEYLRDMFSVIREAIGEDSYLLGCISPLFPFLGELRDDIVLIHKLDGGKSMILMCNKTERDMYYRL